MGLEPAGGALGDLGDGLRVALERSGWRPAGAAYGEVPTLRARTVDSGGAAEHNPAWAGTTLGSDYSQTSHWSRVRSSGRRSRRDRRSLGQMRGERVAWT